MSFGMQIPPFPDTVLVVDDEAVVLDVLGKLFTRKKIPFVTVGKGEEALKVLRESAFGCLLTDKNLPDVDGLTLIRAVRKERPHCACLVMTGYASTESAVEALRIGAVDYLEKPFDDLELVAQKVEKALKTQRTQYERDAFLDHIQTFRAELATKSAEVFRVQTELDMFNSILELRVEQATEDLRKKCAALEAGLEKSQGINDALVIHAETILDFVKGLTFRDGDSMALARAAVTRMRRQLESHLALLKRFANTDQA
jgi:FixJ family two-component response regulator